MDTKDQYGYNIFFSLLIYWFVNLVLETEEENGPRYQYLLDMEVRRSAHDHDLPDPCTLSAVSYLPFTSYNHTLLTIEHGRKLQED